MKNGKYTYQELLQLMKENWPQLIFNKICFFVPISPEDVSIIYKVLEKTDEIQITRFIQQEVNLFNIQ